MSRKSTSVKLGVELITKVLGIPYVFDEKNTLLLPAVPVVLKVPLIVCDELKVKVDVPAADVGPATLILLNVFLPFIEKLDETVVFVKETLLYVIPVLSAVPLVILALEFVQIIEEEPALNIKLLIILNDIGAVPDSVTVLLPKLIALSFEFPIDSCVAEMLKFALLNVPTPKDILLVEVKASPKLITDDVFALPMLSVPENVLPALVKVPVSASVSIPEYVNDIPVDKVTLPDTVIPAVPVNVPVNPVQLMLLAPVFPAAMVTVLAPESDVKKTSSADVGTDAPPAPPFVADHFVPAVPSQLAEPPTQYLSAMFKPYSTKNY